MCDEAIKKAVMTTIHEHMGFMDCDSLRKETGLAFPDLFLALELLVTEQKISINIMAAPEGSGGHFSRSEYLYIKFIALLDRHISCERHIGFYASQLFITPKYLSGIVKKVSGETANYWINKKLLDIVKVQLLCTSKSIKEIAYGLNFSTISSFGKYFKSQTAVSPTLFRKTYTSLNNPQINNYGIW